MINAAKISPSFNSFRRGPRQGNPRRFYYSFFFRSSMNFSFRRFLGECPRLVAIFSIVLLIHTFLEIQLSTVRRKYPCHCQKLLLKL